jgi:succinate dehydrogenase / fumarate reductase, cytochrome b subunit
MARSSARPLSPHLGVYKWGPHMAVSILNRAMGVGLATVGMVALVGWLVAAASGEKSYETFMSWASWWPGYVVAIGLIFTFFFHLCAGLRHFVMDAGAGFELNTNRAWAWGTIIAAVVLTGGTWLVILWKGL